MRSDAPGATQVCFATAMENSSFEEAMLVLDPLERTPDTEAQWQQLGDATLAAVPAALPKRVLPLLTVAERCCAATGNVARAAYLRRVASEYERGLAGDQVALVRAEVRSAHTACCAIVDGVMWPSWSAPRRGSPVPSFMES